MAADTVSTLSLGLQPPPFPIRLRSLHSSTLLRSPEAMCSVLQEYRAVHARPLCCTHGRHLRSSAFPTPSPSGPLLTPTRAAPHCWPLYAVMLLGYTAGCTGQGTTRRLVQTQKGHRVGTEKERVGDRGSRDRESGIDSKSRQRVGDRESWREGQDRVGERESGQRESGIESGNRRRVGHRRVRVRMLTGM